MHDVVVIGSGPAGCATALALLREGISRICIIDSANSGGVAVGETLPPEVRIVLKELGVWDNFLADGHEPCLGSCSAWGSDRLGYNDFLLNPHGPGWHIDRRQFDTFLLSNVASQGIIIHKGQVIGCVDDDRNGFRLFVKGANKVQSAVAGRFVVDATGRRSLFARWTGAEPRLLDRLTLLYGFFDASEGYSSSKLTMIEATEMGWWYAAPLPNRRYAVAFATDPEVVRHGNMFREDCWFASLLRTQHIARRLEGCRFLGGTLVIWSAPSSLLDQVAGANWLAVGDAAATYDPLSSQGIQKALETGVEAARALSSALASNAAVNPDYASFLLANFEDYKFSRNHFYRLETRWTESPFWQHRRERTQLQSQRSAHRRL